MTEERFKELVEIGLKRIPPKFLKKLKNVAIVVEDEPSEEQLESVGIGKDSGDTLLGLYEGVSNLEGGHTHRYFPDRITIFRLPTLDEAEREEDIPGIVEATVRHEIAHHFGMEEEEIERAVHKRRGNKN
ncbi:MAG TPA: metallopeptidase family protein [Candidatus Paceibacterota bacterium]|nr:metallopeptidase family protein [Candidatus Paceibacterota bacterium]